MYNCDTCVLYDGTYCRKEWNNLEDDYKIDERDRKKPEDGCDDWEG